MNQMITTLLFCAALLAAAEKPQTFTGVITDTMCGVKHNMASRRTRSASASA